MELKACTLTLENTAKAAAVVYIYVPNKDVVPYELAAGETLKVTTLSAGESFMYLKQATDTLTVKVSE